MVLIIEFVVDKSKEIINALGQKSRGSAFKIF